MIYILHLVPKNLFLQRGISLLILIFLLSGIAFSQNVNLSGIINKYASVSAIDSCSGKLSVSDTTGFRVNQSIMLLQMNGAEIQSDNSAAFGNISDIKNTGKYEFATIDSVAQGSIFVRHRLVNQYDAVSAKVQAITYPVFASATITSAVRPLPWNGSTGGVIAFEVTGNLTMNAAINADTCGFRGGASFVAADNNCYFLFAHDDYSYPADSWRGAPKGEGIAAFLIGKENGRGAQANGGGGGNDHNSGGGGGGNVTDGGIGGRNDEPDNLGCDGDFAGAGGKNITPKSGRLFLGGGGGAGHTNNTLRSDGGNGGGIIWLIAGSISGNNPTITANGETGRQSGGDGAGGGGAGGTIALKVGSLPANLVVQANGGKGGDLKTSSMRCFGPGGGGAGGRILSNQTIIVPLGGAAGSVIQSTSPCQGSSNGASAGSAGEKTAFPSIFKGSNEIIPAAITAQPMPKTVCEGELVQFSIAAQGVNTQYQWQINTGNGWTNMSNTPGITGTKSPTLTIQSSQVSQNASRYRCQITGGACFALTSNDALLSVLAAPSSVFSATPGNLSVNFVNFSTNYTSIYWDFGDGTFGQMPNTVHTYPVDGSYTVTLYAINNCDTAVSTQVISLSVPPTAAFAVPDTIVGCGTASVQFINQSTANANYAWSCPGGSPMSSSLKNPTITYANSGNYAVTLTVSTFSGTAVSIQSFFVKIIQNPVSSFDLILNNDGLAAFSNTSNHATAYFWDFGDGTTSNEANPNHQFTEGNHTVTLTVTNPCGSVSSSQSFQYYLPPTAAINISGDNEACDVVEMAFNADVSANTDSITWYFPNGTPAFSNDPNPIVTYSNSGSYNAILIANNTAGSDTSFTNFPVTVLTEPFLDFSIQYIGGGMLMFNNSSTGASNYQWDFGDGNSSTDYSPIHTYSQGGTFEVTISATNECNSGSLTKIVNIVLPPVAGFTVADTTTACQTVSVQFNNTSSSNASIWSWSFPNGTPSSSMLQNPTATYSNSGTYTAQLIAKNSQGNDTISQTFVVEKLDFPLSNFDYTILPGGIVQFSNLSSPANYVWFFGDNTAPITDTNPTHQYATNGSYTVTLQAANQCGASVFQKTFDIQVVGTAEIGSAQYLRVFPNPATEVLTVETFINQSAPLKLSIWNAAGKKMFEKNGNILPKETIAVDFLPAGHYTIEAVFEETAIKQAFIKQ